ncbi:proteasome-type protease [Roseiconus nitratireducens]|uniref:Proteasome-type protease n=1 Tax=Roseiconus nitratireducens TaxID=2605748 RepID=A0A5M6DL91_9BACT|nr:proteasome-type protease [Roseiconus nitratireducens]KAA5546115.1 proteasome-type protease [Roseiconus nitratireducens]
MTFCIGIQVREGIIALADTRIVRGSERLNKRKLAEFQHANQSLFTMTSGLRSVRDKTLVYCEEVLEQTTEPCSRLYQFVNLFGQQLRRVRDEDGPSLGATGHAFNLHAIIGGCLTDDEVAQLFYIYPEGNWVEAAADTPYFIIGRTYYGRPILDRLLTYETSLTSALTLALLAFDATRTSVTDVDYPIDVAVIASGSRQPVFKRFSEAELAQTTHWWTQTLTNAITSIPMNWAEGLLPPSPGAPPQGTAPNSFPSPNPLPGPNNDPNSNWQ